MIGILLIVVAVILIAVLIVINTRAFAAKGKANTADENMQSPVAEEPIQEPVQEETAAAAQENHENMAPPSPAEQERIPEKAPNAMGDMEYRNALHRLSSAKPEAPAEKPEKHSMKDNDYRNALKSMNKKREN
ncbi:hypothetical protein LCY76_02930 [Fictibacillus sp. KIGAM418]|uniref:Uncharacterized protein n=1 Tax=Fictibacillus marinisediminis TaxID=2878389 RepID=A0A9X1XA39_9BACL|nr:hypothetical protein [Fictibacillus marinisediminis]MCK6255578.1 hypothetical protein [Fictibacillus marinisediminis]